MIFQVRRILAEADALTGNRSADSMRVRERRLTKMIRLIVIIFIICNSFECGMFILDYFEMIPRDLVEDFLRPFADLLMVINSSVNIVIYGVFNKAFRDKFNEMYIQSWCKNRTKQSILKPPESIPLTSRTPVVTQE